MTMNGWTLFVFIYSATLVSLQSLPVHTAGACPERWLFELGQECVESCPRHNGSSLPYFGNATSGSCEQLSPGFNARLNATQFFANISIANVSVGSTVINFTIIIDPQDITPTTRITLRIDSSGVAGSLLEITNDDFIALSAADFDADLFFYSDHEIQFMSTPANSSLTLSFEIVLEIFVNNIPPTPNEQFIDRSVGQVEIVPPTVPTPRDIDPPILFSSIDEDEVTCPGLSIAFTCTTVNAVYLNWTVVATDGRTSELSFNLNSLPQNQTSVDGFVVTIFSETGNLTSTLVATASSALNGSVVECSNEQHSVNSTILIAGTLSQPVNASYSIVSGSEKALVLVEWNQPPNNSDTPIDQLNYMIQYSALNSNATAITSENTSIILELFTNMQYNVSVAAVNCAGIGDKTQLQIYIVDCGDPLPPARGELEMFVDTVEGSVVYYQCQAGLVPMGRMESVCLSDGSWLPQPSELVCKADCGIPTPPLNGSVGLLNSTVEDSVVTYQCNEGLKPTGEREAVCREDGRWTPNPMNLNCTVDCGDPLPPARGELEMFVDTVEGSVVYYQCQAGLVPMGRMESVCLSDGSWLPQPSELVCKADCGIPTPPLSGSVGLLNGTVEGSVVTYQCNEGLKPAGEREAVCREDGRWTPNPMNLNCTGIAVCGTPPVPDGGHVMLHSTGNTSEGAEATIHCNQFTTVCTSMGVWDPDPQTAICSNVSTTQQPAAQSSWSLVIGLSVSLSSVSCYLLGATSMALLMWLFNKKPSKVVPDSTVNMTFCSNPSAGTEPVKVVEEGEV